MKNTMLLIILMAFILSSCGVSPSTPLVVPTEIAPTPSFTATVPPPTQTYTPQPTFTPTATPILGKMVIPITSMSSSIPWLKDAFDPNAKPGVMYYGFNTTKPPFDNKLVRQAFAAAVDREKIAAIATSLYFHGVEPATTYIPPQILGRDLYGEIGIPFDPTQAKELLTQAGYTDPASFPKTTLYINAAGSNAVGSYQKMAEAVVKMWKDYLGVDVGIKSIGRVGDLTAYLDGNPNGYEIYRMGMQVATDMDMDPTFIEIFHSNHDLNGGYNYSHFKNDKFDSILNDARRESDPTKRQLLYIEAEQILCETEVALIPLYHYIAP